MLTLWVLEQFQTPVDATILVVLELMAAQFQRRSVDSGLDCVAQF